MRALERITLDVRGEGFLAMTTIRSALASFFWQVTPFRLLIAALVTIGYSGQAEEIRITTYNAGLLTSTGFNLVPCVTERTEPQAEHLLNSPLSAPPNVSFAILLQEVWTQYGFDTYKKIADQKHLFMTPSKYEDVENNGEIIITNMPVEKAAFYPFSDDDHAARGIRSVRVRTSKGSLVISNVHTSYSDSSGFLPQHKAQFELIGRFMDALPKGVQFILGGDFNAGPNMSFRQGKTDIAKTIWEDGILPIFTARKYHSVGDMSKNTWSEDTNALVSFPARLIRIMNYYEYGQSEWDQNSARVDHVIAPDAMKVIESGIAMLAPQELGWTCTGRRDQYGRTPLSDHYAAYAKFSL